MKFTRFWMKSWENQLSPPCTFPRSGDQSCALKWCRIMPMLLLALSWIAATVYLTWTTLENVSTYVCFYCLIHGHKLYIGDRVVWWREHWKFHVRRKIWCQKVSLWCWCYQLLDARLMLGMLLTLSELHQLHDKMWFITVIILRIFISYILYVI